MIVFKTVKVRLEFAQQFLAERIESLKKDVLTCIKNTCPFPGLLYCFSTIDLLGSLYGGDATGVATTRKANKFMIEVMRYPKYETNILQNQFRHKLVHLAQPQALILDNKNNRMIGWILDNVYHVKHLIVEKLQSKQPVITLTPFKMEADRVFIVSLEKLLNDIVKSIYVFPDGYIERLRGTANLQEKFDNAVNQIYDTTI